MTAPEQVVVPLPHGLSAIYVMRQPPPPPPPAPVLDDELPYGLMTPEEIAALGAAAHRQRHRPEEPMTYVVRAHASTPRVHAAGREAGGSAVAPQVARGPLPRVSP